MVTNITDFQTLYNVQDGEVASSTVLSRPTNRLKTELNEINSAVSVLMGDTSAVTSWVAGDYELYTLVNYSGTIYKSLTNNNTSTPGSDTNWEDMSALTDAFSSISSGGTVAPEILEFASSSNFPTTGEAAKIYVAIDTNTIYRWSGISYVALTAGGTTSSGNIIMGIESFVATSNQTDFVITGSLTNGAMVYIEGVLVNPGMYSINVGTSTVTFNEPMLTGTNVAIGSTAASVINAEGYVPASRYNYVATAGQTVFAAIYVIGNVDVYRNGLKLAPSDFTATNGTSVALSVGASVGDIIQIMSYSSFNTNVLDTYVLKTGAVMTGALTSFREKYVALASDTIDLAAGNVFSRVIAGATTFVLSNVPASGQAMSFILEVTDAGAYTVSWFAGIKWSSGIAPSMTVSGKDVLGFYTYDGGTTWVGLVLAKDVK